MVERASNTRSRPAVRMFVGLLVIALLAAAVLCTTLLYRTLNAVPLARENLGNRPLLAVSLELSLDPAKGIDGVATLDIGPPTNPKAPYTFLLNPALEIDAIESGHGALTARRDGMLVAVSGEQLADAARITVHYHGKPGNTPLDDSVVWANDRVLLSPRALWYPLDLHSFHRVQGKVALTLDGGVNGARFVTGGRSLDDLSAPDPALHEWETTRAVLGSSLIWGPHEKVERAFGQIGLTLHAAPEHLEAATPLTDTLRALHGFYTARFGAADFSSLQLVVDTALTESWNGWDGVLAVPSEILEDGVDEALVELGTALAENWWGATATGRWFSTRPEGGMWLTRGLSQYSAWRALRQIRGRVSFFDYLEGLPCVPAGAPPLVLINLGETPGGQPSLRGAFAALALSDFTGVDAFDNACRSFLAIHRHTPVSYAAFMHELRLASTKDLDEMLLAWFERGSTFDYALTNVAVAGQRVQMTLENAGNLPAWADLEVAIVGERGVALKTVQARPPRTTTDFETNVTASRVVLDPGFTTPDTARANNVWPRMMWPVSLETTPNHGVIIASKTEWCLDGADHHVLWNPGHPDELRAMGNPRVSQRNDPTPPEVYARMLDHWSSQALLSPTARRVAEEYHPASNVVVSDDLRTATFFDHAGRYVRITTPGDATADAPVVQSVLDLPYVVTRALLSSDGEYAAWIDRAGLLRATQFKEAFPRYTSVQGDILDFKWHGDGALYALAAVSPRLLPMRFHATYSLWRVDNETWNSQEVLKELEHRLPGTR